MLVTTCLLKLLFCEKLHHVSGVSASDLNTVFQDSQKICYFLSLIASLLVVLFTPLNYVYTY